ncbi:uncharacterized protein E0L32_002089 [Thyridium curvatum]|uniref:Beta-mannosidase B n=1 Tax=Thyridium curvatum TaxID=1093900 RepID=A0A507ARC9_9PEZI|nr:uncharacterized protein E0L32_002044 [Thyridium curvatum]XP_030989197.1 uncharacterized protein E0L32_002089 [Thyridium curvatum]TPX07441.1 hypothetical protein E0L32_002044 [Thyridium curvatum]TPX07486.1 hypothetical protein E0L32_002089 [Thyridium curvatum]
MAKAVTTLRSGWEFSPVNSDHIPETRDLGVLPARQLPSEVYLDLLENGKIADPYLDLNELDARWIGECGWIYHTTFAAPAGYGDEGRTTDLIFEGLDTFATVLINGKEVLKSDNMFVSHRINVDGHLVGDKNTLEVRFESARQKGLQLLKDHPEHRWIVHQTELSRGPVRKAQYHWGWDWGPITLGCGIWKPVSLEVYSTRIEDVAIDYTLGKDLKTADIKIAIATAGKQAGAAEIELALDGKVVYSKKLESATPGPDPDESIYDVSFSLDHFKLWWPRNYGEQPLYTLKVTLQSQEGTQTLDAVEKRIGFRKAELIQEEDKCGTSFYFRVNKVDIFAGGSCWIPGDSFPTRITDDKYREWVKLAAEGNQTLIRVWGGGIYESNAFFAACDEFGVLSMQDFGFACASYPTYPEFLKSIELEARQNVRRLRHHPSLIIWAGNNEDYQLIERYNLEYTFNDKDPESWLKTNFPARYIYEHLLPKVIDEETKGTIYRPSCPWGNGLSTTQVVDPTVGDVHQWNIWHGVIAPYQHLPQLGGRFVSEFGLEAYPHMHTLEKFITDPTQRHVGSRTMDFHNKDIGHERHLLGYTGVNFRLKFDLAALAHLTQVMQSDGVTWAYKMWRKMWGVPGQRQCGGVLVWMLNDSWPGISWSLADYNLVPKPSHYAVKRLMAPIAVGVSRKFFDCTTRPMDETWKRNTAHVNPRLANEDVVYDVWTANSRPQGRKGTIVVRFISVDTGRDLLEPLTKEINILANATTDVVAKQKLDVPAENGKSESSAIVIHATLLGEDGKTVLHEDMSWPDPIKYLDLSDRGLEVSEVKSGKVEISAKKPVKGFVFDEVPGLKLSDNGFDIVPGVQKVVEVSGNDGKLTWKVVEG